METLNDSTTETVLKDVFNTTMKTIRIAFNENYLKTTPNLLTNSNISANDTSIVSNYSRQIGSDEWSGQVCKDGLFLPFWQHNDQTGLIIFHGIVYFLALLYTFVGVAIIADRFMLAIEQITSQEQDVIVRKPNGQKEIVSVRIWNETVSNLTLMALGSSAPEILLSIIEVYAQNFEAGELGPGTIVGSAAFNMFVIIAICVWVVPNGTVKKIKHLRVFCITMAFSVFAYVWMLFILIWSTPGVIDVWEGLLTFAFFPLTVLVAFIADRRLLIYKYLDKRYRMKSGRKTVYSGADGNYEEENLELTSVDANGVKLKVNDVEIKEGRNLKYIDASEDDLRQIEEQREEVIEILRDVKSKNPGASNLELEKLARSELVKLQPKSKAYYRIQAARKILGNVTEKVKDHFMKSINDDFEGDEDEEKEESVKIFFNPVEYTVLENVGSFTITVSRSGDPDSTVVVEYNTDDGTAKAGSDYKPLKGMISFGPGESHKQISIEVINDEVFEEDEYFYVRLTAARYLSHTADDKRPNINITEPEAKVTILDDDHSGVFSFNNDVVQIPETIGEYHLRVTRYCGARGMVSLPYKTIPGTAKPGEDFVMADGKVTFSNNEANKDIPLIIINNDNYEKDTLFYVELGEPKRVDHRKGSSETDKGAPRLGELVKCMIHVRESKDFKATVDKLMRKSRAVSAISTSSWEGQFIEAITVPNLGAEPDQELDSDVNVRVVEKKSILAYVVHYLILFWKVLFAFVPPPAIYNGWACFVVSIIVIGLLTALINDLASHFGCTVYLKDSVTAISLVALGTSVPDTFASKIAALNDKYADSSIGNVTGSNAVNVFLGIGCAWTMAAIYHAFKGTEFRVPPGNLSFSVTIFCISAFVCAAVLLLRRSRVVGGELGGPMVYKLPTVLLFVGLWIFYVVISSLEVYKVIEI